MKKEKLKPYYDQEADLWGAKIKATQVKNLLNAMGIIVENLKSN